MKIRPWCSPAARQPDQHHGRGRRGQSSPADADSHPRGLDPGRDGRLDLYRRGRRRGRDHDLYRDAFPINAALNGLRYATSAKHNGSASLTITTNDLGNAGAGGPDRHQHGGHHGPAGERAPVNTVPGSQAIDEDTALVFSSSNGNRISITDVDAGTNPVR